MPLSKAVHLDDCAFDRLFAAVANRAHMDAAGSTSEPVRHNALAWLAVMQEVDNIRAVRVVHPSRRRTERTPMRRDTVNDWQRVYGMTEEVTPAALLTVTRLRLALALGTATADQVTAALAGGADGIGLLLQEAETGEAHAGLEEFAESIDDSFDPFGRMV